LNIIELAEKLQMPNPVVKSLLKDLTEADLLSDLRLTRRDGRVGDYLSYRLTELGELAYVVAAGDSPNSQPAD
jgi:hypothetical protein